MKENQSVIACGHYIMSGFEYISLHGALTAFFKLLTGKKLKKKRKRSIQGTQITDLHPTHRVIAIILYGLHLYLHRQIQRYRMGG
jgi:hypothetical protein